ncbi:hypothetical protein [Streptomyces sp. WMMC940]|uniref:hypothetical protein n=1 Tax=Streptomyces sp. WMMC940 TaxID=3015153 RepID=UPI0022B74116|nr:hypothetical protein [Streptomyces sp. WMMC940]MCZ7456723.1 hypothetical protein [Streptomyces sp. WMMC940]
MVASTVRTDAKTRISARASTVAAQAKEKALRATARARGRSVASPATRRHGTVTGARNPDARPGERALALAGAARRRPGTALAAAGVAAAGLMVLAGARRRRKDR